MTLAKKIGLILIIVGICLPTATLPFIEEFRPVPELCLTTNFLQNMGNMVVVFGKSDVESIGPLISIPYRYLFSIGVVLACAGSCILVLASGKRSSSRIR